MKQVKIDNKIYNFKTNKEDLTFQDYKDLLKVLSEREFVEVSANKGYSKILEEVEIGKESLEFYHQKLLKLFTILCDRPLKKEMFDSFPDLYNILENVIDWNNLNNFESLKPSSFFIECEEYVYIPVEKITFQQWCDFESWFELGIDFVFVVFFIKKGESYDRFFIDKENIIKFINNSKAIDYIPYIKYIYEYVYAIRNRYTNIYNSESFGGFSCENMKIHLDKFKWEDTIITIAESNLFNGPEGSLKAVRDAKALNVLDYLEIKTHKNKAEYLDMLESQKK
jgi:hypothetical protein